MAEDFKAYRDSRLKLIDWFYGFGVYFAMLLIMLGAVVIAWRIFTWPAFFGAALLYISLGITLNMLILKKLIQWHPMYATVESVASQKIRYMAMWPIMYLTLLLRLAVIRII